MKKLFLTLAIVLLVSTLFAGNIDGKPFNKVTECIKLKITSNTPNMDSLYIRFEQNATLGYDQQYDILKIFNTNVNQQFYSIMLDTLNLYINSVSSPTPPSFTIQLGLIIGEDATYTITSTYANSFSNFPMVLLEDTKTSIFIDLTQQPSYTFNGFKTDSIKRFKIHFTNSLISLSSKFGVNGVDNINKPAFTLDKLSESKIYTLDGKQLTEVDKSGLYIVVYNSFAYKIYITKQ